MPNKVLEIETDYYWASCMPFHLFPLEKNHLNENYLIVSYHLQFMNVIHICAPKMTLKQDWLSKKETNYVYVFV